MTSTLGTLSASERAKSDAWWIVAFTAVVVATGMAYTLWWGPVIRHGNYWILPGDLLGTVRATGWIEYGGLSYLYSFNGGLVTLPGIEILLLPFVALSQLLHLVPWTPMVYVRPTEWFLIGPVTIATSAVVLGGANSLASTLGVTSLRRKALLVAEAAVVWEVTVRWGHPEDVLALGLGALALSRALQGRSVSAGWFLGAALAMQLYVVLVIPIFIGLLGIRKAVPFLARAALLPGALLLAMVIPDPHGTLHVLFDQPNFPTVDHPTPWVLIAPHLGQGVVAAGPGRLIGLAAACGLGLLAARYRHDRLAIVWLAAVALAVRCLTEAVMDPYYVAPAIAIALVAVWVRSWPWRSVAAAAGAALTVLTYYRPGIWWYWGEMAAAFAVLLAVAWPRWPWPHGRILQPATEGRASTAESSNPTVDMPTPEPLVEVR